MLDGIGLRLFLEDDVEAVRRTFDDAKAIVVAALLPNPSGGRS
jgi:hypothetical protein